MFSFGLSPPPLDIDHPSLGTVSRHDGPVKILIPPHAEALFMKLQWKKYSSVKEFEGWSYILASPKTRTKEKK